MAERLRTVIVDDEPLARERLRHLLAKVGGVEIVGEATNGMEALTLIESTEPDVVFLDIQMPDLDGMRVLEALDDPPAVIFSTAFEHYAVRAFDLEAADYLLKPYSADRVRRALDRVRRMLAPEEKTTPPAAASDMRIQAQDGNAMVRVPVEEILTLRIEEGVVFLLRDDGEKLICEQTLNELEAQLPAGQFFRTNRQAIVRLAAVESWEPHPDGAITIALAGGLSETASRRRARHFRAMMAG